MILLLRFGGSFPPLPPQGVLLVTTLETVLQVLRGIQVPPALLIQQSRCGRAPDRRPQLEFLSVIMNAKWRFLENNPCFSFVGAI